MATFCLTFQNAYCKRASLLNGKAVGFAATKKEINKA
jgi:hypothetical protein